MNFSFPVGGGLTRDVHLAVSGVSKTTCTDASMGCTETDGSAMFHTSECDVGFYYSGNDIMIGFYRVENTICEDALVTAGYNMTASARARRLEETLPVDHPIRRQLVVPAMALWYLGMYGPAIGGFAMTMMDANDVHGWFR